MVYLFVRHLTRDRTIAWLAALFHLAGGFFLNLAISNEDIMPSYTLMFVAMALAGMWFVRPTVQRVAIVSAIFTLAWLSEWRLMFPALPGLVLALAIAPGSPRLCNQLSDSLVSNAVMRSIRPASRSKPPVWGVKPG